MGFHLSYLHLFLSFLVITFHFASSSHISYEDIEPSRHFGRALLQELTPCSVDFERVNYSVLTSQCKGPDYTPDECCKPLKQLLCPYKDQVNDLNTDCADNFFACVNKYGKYPPGLFAFMCRDEEEGLSCEGANPKASQPTPANTAAAPSSLSSLLFLLALPCILFYI